MSSVKRFRPVNRSRTEAPPRKRHPNGVYNEAGWQVGVWWRDPNGLVWLSKRGVDPAKHKLRRPYGYATDKAHLLECNTRGAQGLYLTLNNGEKWSAPLHVFDQKGIPIERGHGEQVVLEFKWWQRRHEHEEQD